MSCCDYITIKVLFFAKARELIGEKEIFTEVPRTITGKALRDFIVQKYKLEKIKSNVIIAVNENWVDLSSELILEEKDEVAIIPPLSGGNFGKLI